MTYDLKTRRVISLQCLEIHRLAVFVPMLLLFFLSFFFFWSPPLRPDELPWWFFKLRFDDGGNQGMARGEDNVGSGEGEGLPSTSSEDIPSRVDLLES